MGGKGTHHLKRGGHHWVPVPCQNVHGEKWGCVVRWCDFSREHANLGFYLDLTGFYVLTKKKKKINR